MADIPFIELMSLLGAGLLAVFEPQTLFALVIGVLVGYGVGVLPGLGGPTSLALLIPFTFHMDPFAAFALLLGTISVSGTAGNITAILFGIPGESANAAVLADGRPMAVSGEAGRALGGALSASLIGTIFGAICLAFGILAVRPLVLSIGYAEFFMLSLAGLAFLSSLSGGSVVKGLTAGALGLLLAMIGLDPVVGIPRYTFGSLFLWEGFGFIPVILGLYAIPELIEMAGARSMRTEKAAAKIDSALIGVRDAFRHIWLILRCGVLGTYIGLVPGMGGAISQWIAYSHAAQTAKERDRFGKGAIEGVLGPGAADNATMCGALIPTISFGVPGSPQMAILLGAFIIQGLTPGPDMLRPEAQGGNLTLTFSMVSMILVANVIVVGGSFFFLKRIVKIAYLPVNILIPFIVVLVLLGAFASQYNLYDFLVTMIFGLIGWSMQRLHWPRPPLILGLVLGKLIENNLFLAVSAYGMTWVARPSVWIIGSLIIAGLLLPLFQKFRRRTQERSTPAEPEHAISGVGPIAFADIGFGMSMLLLFGYGLFETFKWPFQAAMMPRVAAIAGLCLVVLQLAVSLGRLRPISWIDFVLDDSTRSELRSAAFIWLVLFASSTLIYLFGFIYAVPIILFVYLFGIAKIGLLRSAGTVLLFEIALIVIFDETFHIPFPTGVLIQSFVT